MSVEKIGNEFVKIGVKQEDLEDSIIGLRELKPILQARVIAGNGSNRQQAAIDSTELGKHFDTAIDAMTILLSGFEEYKEKPKGSEKMTEAEAQQILQRLTFSIIKEADSQNKDIVNTILAALDIAIISLNH